MRRLIMLLASASCLAPQAALAQQNESSEEVNAGSGEIIVTAQRRSERLVDVPISITALNGDALERAGIRSTEDLTTAVPGLNFATNGAFAQPTVRGIGSTVTSPGSDANVAIYVDGVYQPSQVANFSDLVDLEQVEVLKGPQGTLFGRNATGGAIRVTTKSPSFTPEVRLTKSYGRFDDVRVTAYGSAPLSGNLAVSLGVLYADDNGYVDNLGTGNRIADSNSLALRGKILFRPSASAEILIAGSHNKRDSNPAFTLGVLNGNNPALRVPGSIQPTGPREVSLSFDPSLEVENNQLSLTAKFDIGFADLALITSYSDISSDLKTDLDRTNLPSLFAVVPGTEETWSQELTLVSKGDSALKWSLGGFYYNDDSSTSVIVNAATTFNTQRLKTEAFAPFGEISLDVGRFNLLAGARYNIEKKDYILSRGTASLTQSETYKTFTPRIGLRYNVAEYANLYATYSKGFKSGGFDGILSAGQLRINPVFPEKVDAFETGFKYGQGNTSLAISAYYYDYANIQFQAFDPSSGGLVRIFNAAAAEIYGGEVEGSFELAAGLSLRGSIAYTKSEYKNFPGATIFCPRGAPAFGNATVSLGALNPCTGAINGDGATGNNLIRTPEITASLSPSYRHDLANGGTLDLSTTAFYSGNFFWDPANRLKESSYVLINGELAYTLPGDQWKLALWGRNLTDKLYSIYVTEGAGGDSVAYARPRSFGIRAELRF